MSFFNKSKVITDNNAGSTAAATTLVLTASVQGNLTTTDTRMSNNPGLSCC